MLLMEKKKFPSREGYKYTYLPKELFAELDGYAAADDRSAAFFVKRAVEAYLIQLRKGGPPGPSLRRAKKKQKRKSES